VLILNNDSLNATLTQFSEPNVPDRLNSNVWLESCHIFKIKVWFSFFGSGANSYSIGENPTSSVIAKPQTFSAVSFS